jgi:hypothetical protein
MFFSADPSISHRLRKKFSKNFPTLDAPHPRCDKHLLLASTSRHAGKLSLQINAHKIIFVADLIDFYASEIDAFSLDVATTHFAASTLQSMVTTVTPLRDTGKNVVSRWKKCRKDVAFNEAFRTNTVIERRYLRVETFEVVTDDNRIARLTMIVSAGSR